MSLLMNWLESLHVDVKVNQRCARFHSPRSACTKCIDSCKHDALAIIDGFIQLDSEKCNGCGDCVINCPLSAVEGIPVGRRFEKNALVYTDSFTPQVKELLIYKRRGIKNIQIGTDFSGLNSEWEKAVVNTNQILNAVDEEPMNIIRLEKAAVSRRDFFQSARVKGQKLTKELAPARWRAAEDDWILTKFYPEHQFYEAVIDRDKCVFCRACFSVCPQKVFSVHNYALTIENNKCIDCSLCRDVCPEQAVSINENPGIKQNMKISFSECSCQECGQKFYSFQPEKHKCMICSDRDPSWLKP
jgi:ferredoxin